MSCLVLLTALSVGAGGGLPFGHYHTGSPFLPTSPHIPYCFGGSPFRPSGPPRSAVLSLSISSDGNSIAAGCRDGVIRVWQVGCPGQRPLVFVGQGQPITSVAFSTVNPAELAAGDLTGSVYLFNLTTGLLWTTTHGSGRVTVSFNRTGQTLASSSEGDRSINFWSVSTGEPGTPATVGDLPDGVSFTRVAFNPTSRTQFATLATDDRVRSYDLGEGNPFLGRSPRLVGSVRALAFSRNGAFIAIGRSTGWVRVWRSPVPGTGVTLFATNSGPAPALFGVNGVAFLATDDNRLVAGATNGRVQLSQHNLGSPPAALTSRLGSPLAGPIIFSVNAVASGVSASGLSLVAAGDDNGIVRVWDANTRLLLATLAAEMVDECPRGGPGGLVIPIPAGPPVDVLPPPKKAPGEEGGPTGAALKVGYRAIPARR